ncbi:LacI family DNA-binding transcriptional regulator [Galactobacter valiniphilus]|uniref:LacI family DNA-binding transcriptional regulator n=1 Tax=Galactobacter valiniphilus TaxID=2676122 RepID=UPI001F3155AA|nr:LacI family DNA-binding transcriptional regulator [Galactobacter valiniphilus]
MSVTRPSAGVGIEQVAAEAGVSTASVSRALSGRGNVSERMRQRVLAAADKLGYVVSSTASSLASGRTRSIGVLTPPLGRWYFSQLVGAVTDELARAGYDTTLYSVTDDAAERRALFGTVVRRRRVDALLSIAVTLEAEELESLRRLGLPLLTVGGRMEDLPALAADEVGMARLATEHLLGLGHRRIAFLGGTEEFDVDFHVPTQRRSGWEEALLGAGVEPEPVLFVDADFTVLGGRDACRALLGSGEVPTAIFAASDEMAIGAWLAAQELGFTVPRDLSIVGIDGHPLGEVYGLTTVTQFVPELGAEAARAVVEHLEHAAPLDSVAPARHALVVRTSTARPARP